MRMRGEARVTENGSVDSRVGWQSDCQFCKRLPWERLMVRTRVAILQNYVYCNTALSVSSLKMPCYWPPLSECAPFILTTPQLYY